MIKLVSTEKNPQTDKANMNKKNKDEITTPPDFRLYYNAMVIKSLVLA
jgi:hypothetical protein